MKTKIFGMVLPLLLWVIFIDFFKYYNSFIIPNLIDTSKYIIFILTSKEIYLDLYSTLVRLILGTLIGVALGLSLALLAELFKSVYSLLIFPIDFTRGIPIPALLPIFIFFFGITDSAKIAMVSVSTFNITFIYFYRAIKYRDKSLEIMAKSFNASNFQIMSLIIIPSLLPSAITGLKLIVPNSLIIIIVSEMFIGSEFGIGQKIFESYSTSNIEALFSYIFFVGVIGLILNLTLERIERFHAQS